VSKSNSTDAGEDRWRLCASRAIWKRTAFCERSGPSAKEGWDSGLKLTKGQDIIVTLQMVGVNRTPAVS